MSAILHAAASRLWRVLIVTGGATLDSLSVEASVPERTCRSLLDGWNEAGLASVHGAGSARTAELTTPRITAPVITRNGDGSITCVSYLDESHVTVIQPGSGGTRHVFTKRKPGR